jgi:hypothetical protein
MSVARDTPATVEPKAGAAESTLSTEGARSDGDIHYVFPVEVEVRAPNVSGVTEHAREVHYHFPIEVDVRRGHDPDVLRDRVLDDLADALGGVAVA